MNELKERLAKLQGRIDELTLRERAILFLLVAVSLFLITDKVLITPQETRQKELLVSITTLRSEINALEQQKLEVIRNHSLDPNAEERAQLITLNQESDRIQRQIHEAVAGMIEPQEMARALEGVLKQQGQLKFVRVSNLGASPLLDVEPAADESAPEVEVGIYKHTMRIELEGSYQRTLDYLVALEKLPWRFHWESVELVMLEYPTARVVITVNTLSMSEGWIGV